MYIHIQVYIFICLYIYIYIYIYTYIYIYIYTHIYTYTYIHADAHIHTHTHTLTCTIKHTHTVPANVSSISTNLIVVASLIIQSYIITYIPLRNQPSLFHTHTYSISQLLFDIHQSNRCGVSYDSVLRYISVPLHSQPSLSLSHTHIQDRPTSFRSPPISSLRRRSQPPCATGRSRATKVLFLKKTVFL